MCVIRFIKNILDIKNILGMQRAPVPDPVHPANQVVIRNAVAGDMKFVPYFTGTITVYRPGFAPMDVPDTQSGIPVYELDLQADTDIVLTGNIDYIEFESDANVRMFALNNTIHQLRIPMPESLEVLDLRNAENSMAVYAFDTYYGREVYVNSENIESAGLGKYVIEHNTINDGILWIDRTGAYAEETIAMAEAKGWTVYDL